MVGFGEMKTNTQQEKKRDEQKTKFLNSPELRNSPRCIRSLPPPPPSSPSVPPSLPSSSSSSLAMSSSASYLPGTASLLEELDKRLMVLLRDGRTLIGYLRSVDQVPNQDVTLYLLPFFV